MDTSFLMLVNSQLEKPSPLETQQLSPVHTGWEINYSWGMFLQGEAVSDSPVRSTLPALLGYAARRVPIMALAAGLALGC